jgi:hypothetical protein
MELIVKLPGEPAIPGLAHMTRKIILFPALLLGSMLLTHSSPAQNRNAGEIRRIHDNIHERELSKIRTDRYRSARRDDYRQCNIADWFSLDSGHGRGDATAVTDGNV